MPEGHFGELLRRLLSGDSRGFEILLQRHGPALRAFVRSRMSLELRAHESCSDLVQSTLCELLSDRDRFD